MKQDQGNAEEVDIDGQLEETEPGLEEERREKEEEGEEKQEREEGNHYSKEGDVQPGIDSR